MIFTDLTEQYTVVVLGGGLAGLTAALQLRNAMPELDILCVERARHPVPEAAFKVGESTVEIAARYFGDMLGLREHLETQQLRKMGLRYFFTRNENHDIATRLETGSDRFPSIATYQIDRGRFENMLAEQTNKRGIHLLSNTSVRQVTIGASHHTLRILHEGKERCISARWLIDATGRSGVLKRHLNLV